MMVVVCLIGPLNRDIPEYAILSHTWEAEGEEVTYEDIKGVGKKLAWLYKTQGLRRISTSTRSTVLMG
jgi:hypothetical protein